MTVSGPTIRARVTQIFRNPTSDWVEAVYVYPLAEGGAVDTLKMVIGDRVVVGEIKERQAARIVYEQARQEGRKAALTEQERPNIFTNSVANIGPGETVLVQIEYQEPVRQSGSEFSLRVPLVVAPRYNPAPVVQTVDLNPGGNGWGMTADPVPDRDRISPPVLDPAVNAPVNPTKITVRLGAGFPLGEVKSHHHAVKVDIVDDATRIVALEGPVPADRDFELTWKPAAEKAPSVGLFRERVGDADYLLAFITPPAIDRSEQKPLPREVIFVIDNSGSMGGTSMVQAKASLLYALGRLQPGDRFNVIRFDDTMDVLFADAVPADSDASRPRQGVRQRAAGAGRHRDGAGDARGAGRSARRRRQFRPPGRLPHRRRDRQRATAVRHHRGDARTLARVHGRHRLGAEFVPDDARRRARPRHLHAYRFGRAGRGAHARSLHQAGKSGRHRPDRQLLRPSRRTSRRRRFPTSIAASRWSSRRGSTKIAGSIEIKGRIGDRPWIVTLPLANAAEGQGLSKLWARRKIAEAEVARTMRQRSAEDADKAIIDLALGHQLVTRLTSLVAVDKTPSRPAGAPLKVSELPLNLPAGWDFAKVFGERPQPMSPPHERRADAGDGRVQLAMAKRALPVATSAPGAVVLPKTATDAELRMIAGVVLVMLSLILFAFNRRQRLSR